MAEQHEDPIARVVDEVRELELLERRSTLHRDPHVTREPESELVVRHADCDAGGLLGSGALLAWIEHLRARHLLDAYGVDLVLVQRRWRRILRASEHELRWLGVARGLETLRVRTRLIEFDASSTRVETWVLDEPGRRLKAWCRTRYTWFDLESGETVEHRPDHLALLQRILVDAGLDRDPDARVAAIHQHLQRSK